MPNASSTPSLYERVGGTYGIAGAVDVLADRLYDNASANTNPHVAAFHPQAGQAGFKYLVTAGSIEQTGGPACYPGRDMHESHAHLNVTEFEFDIVAGEIAATLYHVGVPRQEHGEFMAIIESYRSMVVGTPAEKAEIPEQEREPAAV
jgi:hemoglobin